MADSFTHLHVHTEYSMLDGAARIADVVGAAAADGQPALGITDHGNMYGILDFYRACKDQGIKPVLGTELYMAHESRSERPSRRGRLDDGGGDVEGGSKLYYHLTALAETDAGLQEPHPAVEPGVPRGLLLQAPRRLGAPPGAQRGPHRHHRVPRRPRPPAPDARRLRRRGEGGRPAPGHLRAGQPLRRAAGPRASPSSTAPTRCSSTSPRTCRRRCSPPTTATTSTGPTPSPTTRSSACRPARR